MKKGEKEMLNFGKVKKLEQQVEVLKNIVEYKQRDKEKLLEEIRNLHEAIRILRNNEYLLLETAEKLRSKNEDLENNVEFLVNNLSREKRKLIRGE